MGVRQGCPEVAETLEATIDAAIGAWDDLSIHPLAHEAAGSLVRTKALLRWLTICYARQIYSSADVGEAGRREVVSPVEAEEESLDAEMIRQFRDENREAIWSCLYAALSFMAKQEYAADLTEEIAVVAIAEEANRRIVLAMFFDGMELDNQSADDVPVVVSELISTDHSQIL